MGKSPGKWIKTVLFGKKSSKSNLSKDAIINKKTSIITKPPLKDFDNDSMVISSPILPVIHTSGEGTELEKTASANLTSDTIEAVRSNMELNTAKEDDLIKLEQAAIKTQAAFRGYMARRAFYALKGIIRLQAQVRGRLVRRQAVATLSCMRAIVELQSVARGRRVRLSGDGGHMVPKYNPGELLEKKRADLLGTSLRSEKLSTNAFGTKLVASSPTIMPLIIQYDPTEPNSVPKWLHRWSSSHFWEPLPRLKKKPDSKPKRKQTKLQPEEPETGKPKRNVRRVSAATNLENNPIKSSKTEKPKPTSKKTSSHTPESDSPEPKLEPEPEPEPEPPLEAKPQDGHRPVEPPAREADGNVELNGSENHSKENQKTRRRKSFPAKPEFVESGLQNTAALPSYMAATESAKAKLRAQAVAKAAEDGGENGFMRRHLLPSSTTTTGKLSLQSPQVQKPLQANNSKGSWTKSNKPQIFSRDDKVQMGWKR